MRGAKDIYSEFDVALRHAFQYVARAQIKKCENEPWEIACKTLQSPAEENGQPRLEYRQSSHKPDGQSWNR